jgi:hypothetical protein
MKDFFSKNLPHIYAIIGFIAITLIFFGPLLQGKHLKQHDTLQWEGMAREITQHREATGEEPLWTNAMFSGMPAFQISVLYPKNLYMHIDRFFTKAFPGPSVYIFLAMLTFYFLLVGSGFSSLISFIGAFAFAFSSYQMIIIQAGHNSKANAIAWMPLVVLGVMMAFRGRYWIAAAVATFAVAMQINANHFQITYYLLLVLIFIGIAETIKTIQDKDWSRYFKSVGVLIGAAILGVLPNITQLWVTAEYGQETTRGRSELTMNQDVKTTGLDKDYATAWSYGTAETFSLLVPNFKGGGNAALGNNKEAMQQVDPQMRQVVSQMDQYWGDQPGTSGPVYVGAIICFLFILGLLIVEGPLKWALLGATILSIMLSWGKNFMPLTDFFLDNIPGYNKFRAVSMTLVMVQFTMPFLGIMALWKVLKNPAIVKEKQMHFWIAFGLTGGLAFLMYLMPDMFNNFLKAGEYENLMAQLSQANWPADQSSLLLHNLEEARKAIFTADAIRSAIFITLAAGAIFFYSRMNFNSSYLLIALLIFVVADQWTIAKRYLNEDHYVRQNIRKQPHQPTQADLQILQDPDPNFRVMNVTVSTFNDASTSYFHKSIGGYHGAKLKRYQELIEYHISQQNFAVLNMLNTKYFIVPGQDRQPVVQPNRQALGNAWFVNEYKMVANADSEIVAMNNFDPSSVAIVDERFRHLLEGWQPEKDGTGNIKLTAYKPNHITYDFHASSEQLVVFSEIFYNDKKGWKAFIDGNPVEHFRVNYVLRALRIPAGNHTVDFKFEPQSYFTGENIALAGSILSVLLIGLVIYKEKISRRAAKAQN